jgi:hypothetical protein
MPEVYTETEWLHDTVPSWVTWRVSLGASTGRRDCIHGPIHGFARSEQTRHCLVRACRRAAKTPTRVAAFEEGQRQGPVPVVGRIIGTSRGDDGQRHLCPEERDMATPEDLQCYQMHGAQIGGTLPHIRTLGGIGTTVPHPQQRSPRPRSWHAQHEEAQASWVVVRSCTRGVGV